MGDGRLTVTVDPAGWTVGYKTNNLKLFQQSIELIIFTWEVPTPASTNSLHLQAAVVSIPHKEPVAAPLSDKEWSTVSWSVKI